MAQKHSLLASELTCHCEKTAKLNKRQRLKDSFSFRNGSDDEFECEKALFSRFLN